MSSTAPGFVIFFNLQAKQLLSMILPDCNHFFTVKTIICIRLKTEFYSDFSRMHIIKLFYGYAIPKSSTSNISVEPPGIPGWENLP